MANKIRFTLHNQADLVTNLAATTEETTLPAVNMQLTPRSKIWRSTAGTVQSITGTLASAQNITTITVGRHNLTQNSTVEIWLYSGVQSGQLANDSITISAAEAYESASTLEYQDLRNITWYSEDANNDKVDVTGVNSFRVDITGSGMSYIDVGRLFVGDFIEPTYNISYGHALSYEEQTKQYRTASGTLRSDVALPYKRFNFNINTISEADRAILMEAFADVGKRRDFYMSIYHDPNTEVKSIDYSGIVKLSKIPKYTEIQCSWYKSKYTMDEV